MNSCSSFCTSTSSTASQSAPEPVQVLEMPGTSILINPIADLCHVTADGVEVLNRFPRELFHA